MPFHVRPKMEILSGYDHVWINVHMCRYIHIFIYTKLLLV